MSSSKPTSPKITVLSRWPDSNLTMIFTLIIAVALCYGLSLDPVGRYGAWCLAPALPVLLWFVLRKDVVEVYRDRLLVWNDRRLIGGPLEVPLTSKSTVRLRYYTTLEHATRGHQTRMVTCHWWEVGVDDTRVVREADAQATMRRFAEALSRATGCPFVDESASEWVRVEPDDLDLRLRDRLERHPRLRYGKPDHGAPREIRIEELADGHCRLLWRTLTPLLATTVVLITAVILSVWFWPLDVSQSFFDKYGWPGFIAYARPLCIVAVAVLVYLAGLDLRIDISRDHFRQATTFMGIPIVRFTSPVNRVEEVRDMGNGKIAIISDDSIITLKKSFLRNIDEPTALWLRHWLQTEIARQQPRLVG